MGALTGGARQRLRRMQRAAVADLDESRRFLTETLGRIDGVANTRTTIPVKRIKETTAPRVRRSDENAARRSLHT